MGAEAIPVGALGRRTRQEVTVVLEGGNAVGPLEVYTIYLGERLGLYRALEGGVAE